LRQYVYANPTGTLRKAYNVEIELIF
jgi:hypothetical protein